VSDPEDPSGISLGMCQCTGATQRAIFVRMPGERSDRCIPLSVVHDDSEVYESGHAGNLVVAAWWAEKEGLA
jgi:hypothetical protein